FKSVHPRTKTPHLGGEKLDDGLTAQEFEDLVALEPNSWEAEQEKVFDQPKGEPLITAAQLRAIHTRLTKLGFNGKASEKERAREFVGFLVGRELASSKDLTKAEAMRVLDLSDDDWALRLDDFNAEQQMAAEGEA